jgi:polysaccharide deacetylase 2 family uncharacterized protein YibQ
MARNRVGQQVGLGALVERAFAGSGEPGGVKREVAAIGVERVERETVLDPQRIDEAVDGLLALLAGLARTRAQPVTPASA